MFKRRMRHEAKPAALLDGARLGTTPQDSRPALRNGYTSYICSWIPANIAYNMQQVYTHLYIYIYTHVHTHRCGHTYTCTPTHTNIPTHKKHIYTRMYVHTQVAPGSAVRVLPFAVQHRSVEVHRSIADGNLATEGISHVSNILN
jgi:hypothetical protein